MRPTARALRRSPGRGRSKKRGPLWGVGPAEYALAAVLLYAVAARLYRSCRAAAFAPLALGFIRCAFTMTRRACGPGFVAASRERPALPPAPFESAEAASGGACSRC